MNILIANFGNDSLGLIQHAYMQKLQDVSVVSVDTGWANPAWNARVVQAEHWVKSLGFSYSRLKSKLDFASLVKAQGEFPSTKFQWCAIYLKGDTLRAWLHEVDPLKESTILIARRRAQSPKFHDLPEFIEHHAEEFEDRRIWHPLYLNTETDLRALIKATPFDWIPHRSLECDPCVNSDAADLQRLPLALVERLKSLEVEIDQLFLPDPKPGASKFLFDMGCGSPYGCGL